MEFILELYTFLLSLSTKLFQKLFSKKVLTNIFLCVILLKLSERAHIIFFGEMAELV